MKTSSLLAVLSVLLICSGAGFAQISKYTCSSMSAPLCAKGTCPTGYVCSLSGKACACVVAKATTTTSTTTTTLVSCPAGCNCMTESAAEDEYDKPQKCVSGVCGYYTSSMTTAYILVPKYCFREALSVTTSTMPMQPAQIEHTCSSCLECSRMLESGVETVYLSRDLRSTSASCIEYDADDVVFDCDGHTISGYGTGQEFYYGIEVRGDGNTIQNCVVEGFEAGIATYSAERNLFQNNTLRENVYGIWLGGGMINNATGEVSGGSNDNTVRGNLFEENENGVYLAGNRNTKLEDNRICESSVADVYTSPYARSSGGTRTDNVCDLVYNWNGDFDVSWCARTCTADAMTTVSTASGLQEALGGDYGSVNLTGDVSLAGGLSFDASHVTLECNGHRIRGTGTGTGILIKNKVNVEVRGCVIEDYTNGVVLEAASYSRILSNEIKDNSYGLIVKGGAMPSRGSNVSRNSIAPSGVYGAYLIGDSYGNTFRSNNLGGGQYSLYTEAVCDNDIDDSNLASALGGKIIYVHDRSGVSMEYDVPRSYPEVILCNVKNSRFRNFDVDNGGGIGSDGVIIRDCANVNFTASRIVDGYGGIAVINSSDVLLARNQIHGHEKSCVSVEKSRDVEVSKGTLEDCETGAAVTLSRGTKIKEVNPIEDNRVAGIKLYMSSESEIKDNVIRRGAGPDSAKGIIISESSEDNTIDGNIVNDTAGGIDLDATSGGNYLRGNRVCNNSNDVYDRGNNSGRNNICSRAVSYSDAGTKGCTACCIPAVDDLDGDGIDDACDCADLHLGYGETGVDCGGKCPDCIECTWCDSSIEPLRLRGRPNDGYIDIVFAPEEDWGYNMSGFEARVKDAVRKRFLELDNMSTRPIYDGYEDMFNFYIYKGGVGQATSDADSCYDPEGPEGYLCIGCRGWLPGEKAYHDWVYACSFTCALTLGFGCGCLAFEPDHFWEHASFADSAGLIYTDTSVRGCSGFGPTSHYQAEYQGLGSVIIHESGHSLFALTDEYCGDTAYSRAGSVPNVWNSLGDCQSAAASEGWTDGNCTQIQKINDTTGEVICSKDNYRYDTDAGNWDTMRSSNQNSLFKEADVRRINHVFENWPSGGSKGIISYVTYSGGEMKGVMSRVVPNHPDLGNWVYDFVGLTRSSKGEDIDRFTFSDPRMTSSYVGGEGGGIFSENTTFTVIVPMHEGIRWLSIFNGSDGSLETTIDLGPAIWNFCEETDWSDEYCLNVDLDDNGVADSEETDDWEPEERTGEAPEGARGDLALEPEESGNLPFYEGAKEERVEETIEETKETAEGGIPWIYLILGGLALFLVLAAILALIVVVMAKKK